MTLRDGSDSQPRSNSSAAPHREKSACRQPAPCWRCFVGAPHHHCELVGPPALAFRSRHTAMPHTTSAAGVPRTSGAVRFMPSEMLSPRIRALLSGGSVRRDTHDVTHDRDRDHEPREPLHDGGEPERLGGHGSGPPPRLSDAEEDRPNGGGNESQPEDSERNIKAQRHVGRHADQSTLGESLPVTNDAVDVADQIVDQGGLAPDEFLSAKSSHLLQRVEQAPPRRSAPRRATRRPARHEGRGNSAGRTMRRRGARLQRGPRRKSASASTSGPSRA